VKKPIQGLIGAVFYAALYLGLHRGLAAIASFTDPAAATILANLLAVVLGLLTANALGDRPLRPARTVEKSILPDSVLIGFGWAAVVLLALTYLPLPSEWLSRYTQSTGDITQRTALAWLSALVVAPIAEEIVFRGLIYRSLRQTVGGWPAALVVSAFFGWIHGNPLWAVYTFSLGLLTVWLMERSGTIWAAVLCHMAFNLCGQLPAWLPTAPLVDVIYLVLGASAFLIAVIDLHRKRSCK